MQPSPIDPDAIIHATRLWVERAVIGLGLCPFAAAVYANQGIRFQVTEQTTAVGLIEDLRSELSRLHAVDPAQCETTLLIHPWVLNDFLEYNEFLQICDDVIRDLDLEGEIQVASFHPQYQFAGTQSDDIENFTNRSPYPTLHLLRELSVERALAAVPDPASIYENNIQCMRRLGAAGWRALFSDASPSTRA
jgi:hypothetical protein